MQYHWKMLKQFMEVLFQFFQLEMLFLFKTVARVNSKSNGDFILIFLMQKQGIKQPQNMVEEWNLIIKMNSYFWHLEVDAHHVSTRGCHFQRSSSLCKPSSLNACK
jgi:hypothetical protein